MNILIFLLFISASSATFHKLKPEKLVKHLVEPFVDVAIKGIFTGGIIEPIGHFIKGRIKKSKHHHHKSKYQEEDEHYHRPYHHERELYYHRGGGSYHPQHHYPCEVHEGDEHYYPHPHHHHHHSGQQYSNYGHYENSFYPLGGEGLHHEGYHYADGYFDGGYGGHYLEHQELL